MNQTKGDPETAPSPRVRPNVDSFFKVIIDQFFIVQLKIIGEEKAKKDTINIIRTNIPECMRSIANYVTDLMQKGRFECVVYDFTVDHLGEETSFVFVIKGKGHKGPITQVSRIELDPTTEKLKMVIVTQHWLYATFTLPFASLVNDEVVLDFHEHVFEILIGALRRMENGEPPIHSSYSSASFSSRTMSK